MRARLLATIGLLLAAPFGTSYGATTYTYDSLGRVWIVTYDNGMQITYTYDAAGNRTQVVTNTAAGLPPQAGNLWLTTYGTQLVKGYPLSVDSDPNGYSLQVTGAGTAPHGTTAYNTSEASVSYTPSGSFIGTDSFTYTITNSHGQTAQGTIYVNNVAGNPPVATDITTSTAQNTQLTLSPLSQDSDPLGYTMVLYSVTQPSHGTSSVSGSNVLYTPTTGYTGSDTFTYTISDQHGQYGTGNITVNVGSPPVAVADYIVGTLNTAATFDPRTNDSDPFGYQLTVTPPLTTPSPSGTAVINANNTITYTPQTGYSGRATFTYILTNSHGLSSTAQDSVCIGHNLAAVNDSVLIQEDGPLVWTPNATFDPRSNDTITCQAPVTITAVTQPSIGTATINNSGGVQSVTYTWPSQVDSNHRTAVGSTSFTYTIVDAYGTLSTGTVNVTVDVNWNNN